MENRLKNDKITNMKKKVTTIKKNSSAWLIIFLCAIVVGLVWLVNYSNNLGEANLLNEEIKRLNQKLENQEKLRNEDCPSLSLPLSTPSASTSSANQKVRTSTISGEEK